MEKFYPADIPAGIPLLSHPPATRGAGSCPVNLHRRGETMEGRTVGSLKIDIFSYPHMPYWFTLRQAIEMMKQAMSDPARRYHPLAVLVFDQRYSLMGTVTLREIIRGLEPKFLLPAAAAQGYNETRESLALIWGSMLTEQSRELSERPVVEIMVPVMGHVTSSDPVTMAAYLMIHQDVPLIPVIDDGAISGIVRITDIFEEIALTVLA